MMCVEPLTLDHVQRLVPQPAQAEASMTERSALAMANASSGPAYAALVGDTVVCVGGLIADPGWPGRAVAWALLSADCGAHLRELTSACRAYLGYQLTSGAFRRIELYVDAQFTQGCRWARLLGFTLETRDEHGEPRAMPGFLPNGNGAYLFGRVA